MFIIVMHTERWTSMFNHMKLTYTKKSVINMGTKVYSKVPGYIKKTRQL
jgi:hypothetical protein